jgi:hypothetical protein
LPWYCLWEELYAATFNDKSSHTGPYVQDQSEVGILNVMSVFEISLRRTSLIAFMNPFDIQMYTSWYQAIDEKRIKVTSNLNPNCPFGSGEKRDTKRFPRGCWSVDKIE